MASAEEAEAKAVEEVSGQLAKAAADLAAAQQAMRQLQQQVGSGLGAGGHACGQRAFKAARVPEGTAHSLGGAWWWVGYNRTTAAAHTSDRRACL